MRRRSGRAALSTDALPQQMTAPAKTDGRWAIKCHVPAALIDCPVR
jgi:hypothetical protein